MNWLDRTIGWISPEAAFRRARYRAMAEAARLAYEGAKVGRRTGGWLTTNASANAEIGVDLPKLRERSRDLVRNNHFAAKAAIEFSTKIVGPGITARTKSPQAADLWRAWQRECSADGLPHFAGVQALIARTVFEAGEVLIRQRTRTRSVGKQMSVPLQIQVLEPDYLDQGKTFSANADGNYAIQGVEFNSWGQRVAYWLYSQHPGEVTTTNLRLSLSSSRVPADQVLHVFEPLRPGQVRGVPHLAPIMLALRDLDDWEDAELVRKKTEACLAGVITTSEELAIGQQTAVSMAGPANADITVLAEQLAPGMLARIRPGEDIKFLSPNYAGGYAEYKRSRVRDLAVGIGMIYEILSGDQSQTNYSSYRAGLLGFRDRIEALQWNVIVPACDVVWNWFIEAAIDFAGLPSAGEYAAEWQPPAFDLLDREAEAKGDALMLQAGTMTWPQAVQRQGYDPEVQIEEVAKWKPRLDAAGVTFTKESPNAQPQK